MRHRRHEGSKVWHNPALLDVGPRGPAARSKAAMPSSEQADRGAELFTRSSPVARVAGRIVQKAPSAIDARTAEERRLRGKLLAAESRPSVTRAASDYLAAGFAFPAAQDVLLQLLEHVDEVTVAEAIDALSRLVASEEPKRRAVLDSRLRRIEAYADDPTTRIKAADLRRHLAALHPVRIR